MRATFKTKNGQSGFMEHPVIVPQPMQHTDGFTLLGFEDWKCVTDEELCAATTNIEEFTLVKDEIGFERVKEQN